MADTIALVNEALLQRILNTETIMHDFPELRKLKNENDYIIIKNCSGCEKKRKSRMKFRRFCAILFNMESSRLNRLKQLLNVSKLEYTGYNPKINTVGIFFL